MGWKWELQSDSVTINRTADVVERTFWTFIQAFIAIAVVTDLSWTAVKGALLAAGLSTLKTVAAQHVGDSPVGDALPGVSVVEPTKDTVRPA